MRRNFFIRFACVLVLTGTFSTALTQVLDDPATAKKKYDAMKTRVIAGDLSIDWREFRLAAMVAGVNGGFDWRSTRNKAFADLDKHNTKDGLSEALSIIDHNMANPEGHMAAFMAYKQTADDKKADTEKAIILAIIKSIDDSGDGKSVKTAYFTVDPSEEYFYINVALGGTPKSQALSNQDGHAYDIMTITDKDGHEQQLWFNTDTDMQIMDQALNPKKK